MHLLIDTHVLLWSLGNTPRLTPHWRTVLIDPAVHIIVSTVSVWEISLKKSLGKLQAPEDLREVLAENDFQVLPVTLDHALAFRHLPWHHRDPFDRMLVAQACIEKFTLLSSDSRLQNYEGLDLVIL